MTPLILPIALSLLIGGSTGRRPQPLSQSLTTRVDYSAGTDSALLAARLDNYRTYSNARYGFSISYPANLLTPQGESDNGDGQKFMSRDGSATLTVFGSNRMDRSLQEEYRSAQENRSVTYRVIRRDIFVVSGTENGKIFYQKTLLRGDAFKTFIIEYDEGQRGVFDAVTSRIARSFVG